MKKVAIFCGSYIDNYDFLSFYDIKDRYIICADGGVKHCNNLNIVPDLIIGDNDSAVRKYPKDTRVILYSPEKDFTDTQLCVDYAIENGAYDILLFGATGGRLDHEYANYCTLKASSDKDVLVKIIDRCNEIYIKKSSFDIKKDYLTRIHKKYVSFFPFGGEVTDFSLKGFKYEVDNAKLTCGQTLTCSNELSEKSNIGEVTFKYGYVLVVYSGDLKQNI